MSPPQRTGTTYWLHRLLDDERLDATETLLLIGLADHVNADDEAWPSIETLAGRARCSYGTARRRLASLEDRGILTRTRKRRDDGNLSVYVYRLIREDEPARNEATDHRAPGRALTIAHPGARAEPDQGEPDQGEGTTSREDVSLPLGSTSREVHPAATTATFDEFWSVYPRHTARRSAEQAWPRAVKRAKDAALIVAGARRYADDPNRDDGFTAHAATWLNGDRWTDEPLPPRAAVGGKAMESMRAMGALAPGSLDIPGVPRR